MPSLGNTTGLLSTRLSGLTVGLSAGESTFKAAEIFPILPVDEFQKNVMVVSNASMRRAIASKTADGVRAPRIGMIKTQLEINIENLSLASEITAAEMKQSAAAGIDETELRTAQVNRGVLVKREMEMHDSFFTTGVWDVDASGNATPSTATQFLFFDDAACDPVDVIRTFADQMTTKLLGQKPNKLCVSPDVHAAIAANPSIKDRLFATIGQKEGTVEFDETAYAKLFSVEKYIVLRASADTTNQGAAEAPTDIFDNEMLLLYAPDTYSASSLSPAAGYLAVIDEGGAALGGSAVRQWIEDDTNNTVVEAMARIDFLKAVSAAGVYFSSVISA